jgi:hypothetical protein
VHFDISKYPKMSVKSFDIEELNGQDELDAVARATMGGQLTTLTALQVTQTEQLIAQSISKVNGEPVMRPYTAWRDWTIRTRELVQVAYNRVNSVSIKEQKDFLATHFGEGEQPASPGSSPSGSGQPGI